ncbi:CNNM domain-containing protein [Mycoplasma phocimorsus]|uniref:CNNM domain-containing protein n=1 Tax=Mycoplasma phocimorsus TaxID=3045839 RepID=UPI0024C00299|nr:CNNM domain-containing protein [Mycoplasma phocimorsus]MDJ1648703.1 CNNM domain-containing protein [Mycoplasma phocimorsus]
METNSQIPLSIKTTLYSIVLLFVIISAIFSGAEMAYSTINPGELEEKISKKSKIAALIKRQRSKFNMLLTTILIGNNIVNIASASLLSFLLSKDLSGNDYLITIISTLILTPIIIIFGEITPKMLAKKSAFNYLAFFVYFILIFYYLFWPVSWLISKMSKEKLTTNSEVELKHMINIASEEGVLEKHEEMITKNALDLDNKKVAQHYIKLSEIDYLNYTDTVAEAKKLFKETYYSRIPLMKDNQLISFVHIKDIFDLDDNLKIFDVAKFAPIISANSTLSSALDKLRLSRAQMGFVVKNNSSSKTIGIITIEDIIEELVGEIYDEFDEEEDIIEMSVHKFKVKGKTSIKELEKVLEIDIKIKNKDIQFKDWLFKNITGNITRSTRYNYKDAFSVKTISINRKTKEFVFEITLI